MTISFNNCNFCTERYETRRNSSKCRM